MAHRSETFGRLLKGAINSIATYEGKTAPIIEEELGAQIHIAGKTIQRYKSGHVPPEEQTIRVLAEAAVQRGFLGREWLQRFLHAARYPFAAKLLDQLCPIGPERPRPPRIYENLPAPTYSQFVMRQQAFAEVVDGLQQRSAVVLIVGMGGNGKTSLAREVAAHCLQEDNAVPQFSAVVWVSDKDRPGTTNLSIVLDEIARTLDYPGFTQFEHDEKRREVEQLLKRQKVLLVVDNFETITDGALLTWLLRLPDPSKAVITTREYRRELRSSWPVELRGMTEAEAWELITERAQVLKIEQVITDQTRLEPLVIATGGNPKALTMTLGLLKYERRPLQQVVDDLYAARGEIFNDLFTRAWALLDEASRRMLLVTTFFPTSASDEALAATADVQGFAFDRAVERLTDLALLDVQQEDLTTAPRYALHSLVRAFAGARLAEEPEFERSARERWVGWYVQLASMVGTCWDNLGQLELLDPEQETIFTVIKWTYRQKYYQKNVQLIDGVRYYYNVRGLWDNRLTVCRMRIEATRNLPEYNAEEEARSLGYYIEVFCKQGKLEEAEQYLPQLQQLCQSIRLSDQGFFRFQNVLAMYAMSRHDLDTAIQIFQSLLNLSEQLEGQSYVLTRRWLATCLYYKGKLDEARRLFQESLHDAEKKGVQRSVIGNRIKLAAINLDCGNIKEADEMLEMCRLDAQRYKDQRRMSEIQPLLARLHTLRGDLPAARTALTEAIDLFERLGMRRELAEARQALADLDVRDVAEAAG